VQALLEIEFKLSQGETSSQKKQLKSQKGN